MFYNKLKKILEYKDHVMVRREDGNYCVFSSVKDEEGNFRVSSWYYRECAKKYIADCYGEGKEYINRLAKEQNWQIVEMWDNPKKRFVPGDKVKIADNAKELCEEIGLDWDKTKQAMIGMVCEVDENDGGDYFIWDTYKDVYRIFPHSALIPIFEEEEITIKVSKKSLEALKKCGIKIIKE
jgi:hypothetical protein